MNENEKLTTVPGKEDIWASLVKENQDPYGHAVIEAVSLAGAALDAGKTPKEAQDVWSGLDLTGFMAGYAAKCLSQLHPRGDEWREGWNAQYDVTEEKAKGGVVNPAILTIGD